MTVQARTARRFDRSSPVARYWLAQCEGFRVKGTLNGTVEKVVGSVDRQRPESLVVRTAWRRCNIPVEQVDAVVPAARMIVVDNGAGGIAQAPTHHRVRALADASSNAADAVVLTVAEKAPPLARFVRDVLLALGLFLAAALVALARSVAHTVRVSASVSRASLKPPPRR